ncbi:mannose-1-phosphate guanylyltransferase/mannose-6-phosphate isomerase [Aliiroseovarius sp. F20344]|uniref:mannose-1-phosphate guanylyltransferase/mannose-6-phosphate isomerase n=1 Tax=Aliiroseovarius sp. F20344 TaxID=2926414 RepID=UPI001FF46C2B|nr:mannose-1-phosphate guanylyltransferase/mannose-6-phosphate isomerase [Aliiroseovarius sp. F20344]
MKKIVPIVLAGGIGTRLWPISRQSYPKQFRKLAGADSLFQDTIKRFQGSAYLRPIVVTNENYRFHVVEQMGEIASLPEQIFLEPVARNTAPAVLAATLSAYDKDPDAICIVTPADHLLPDHDHFTTSVVMGMKAVADGHLTTFGITPDRPETGYGYLELSSKPTPDQCTMPLKSFTEKPDPETAVQMLAGGRHLWNAGIFLFRAREMIDAFKEHAPDMIAPVQSALDNKERDLGFTRLPKGDWEKLPDVSIDYAIMEKQRDLHVVPFGGRWSDLGGWQSIWREEQSETSNDGTVTLGDSHAVDCTSSLLLADDPEQLLVGLGLENMIAVATKDAVLVADKCRSAEIGELVKDLSKLGKVQAKTMPRDYRPWGWFERLVSRPGFQVKIITVHPGGVLSLQSHEHRSEHWVVVEGCPTVTIGPDSFDVPANQSVYVPLGAQHRLENNGTQDVVLIEVQTGAYLGEDDITRYEDAYARS